jgi:nucleotide-binding universal stress UspA family protein
MTIGGEMAERLRKNAEARSMAMLEEYKKLLEPCDMDVELISRSGRPDYVILNVQDELDCDLIVIGSRGLSILENVIMGSVVTRVLEGANCPVLVTRNLRLKYLQDACGI